MIKMNASKKIFVIGFLILLCSGCAVGPNYKKPAVPVPPEYRGLSPDQAGKSDAASFGDQKWFDAFQDKTFRGLIQTALKPKYNLRSAAARIPRVRRRPG